MVLINQQYWVLIAESCQDLILSKFCYIVILFLVKLQVLQLTLLVSSPCFPDQLTNHLLMQKFQEPTPWWCIAHPSSFEWNFLTEFLYSLLNIRVLLASYPFPVPGLWNFVFLCFLHFFGNRNCQERQNDHNVPFPELHPASHGYLLWTRNTLPSQEERRLNPNDNVSRL